MRAGWSLRSTVWCFNCNKAQQAEVFLRKQFVSLQHGLTGVTRPLFWSCHAAMVTSELTAGWAAERCSHANLNPNGCGLAEVKVPASLHLATTLQHAAIVAPAGIFDSLPLMHMLKRHAESAAIYPQVALREQVCTQWPFRAPASAGHFRHLRKCCKGTWEDNWKRGPSSIYPSTHSSFIPSFSALRDTERLLTYVLEGRIHRGPAACLM